MSLRGKRWSILNLVDESGYCFLCGGIGLDDSECPSCGRKPKKSGISFEDAQNSERFVEKIDRFGVPGPYRGVFWSADVLRKQFPDLDGDLAFQRFVNQLDKVHDVFAKGLLSSKSAIIIAPAGFSKEIFAYSCMQLALDKGLSVAPYLDTVELKRLLVLSGESPGYRLFDKISYDDYVMSDVCFITVTKLPQREWAYNIIQELIDRRSRKGFSTFVISRYSLNEISRRDKSNQFGVISTADSHDTLKYPSVISYRKM
jgi:hypothetical protein